MEALTGVITVAQETRFRLVDEAGRGQTFLLASNAPIEPQDLQDLQRAQARVTVRFTEPGDLIAKIAHDISILGPTGYRTGDPT